MEGCDIDPVVLTNPFLDHAEVIEPGKPLPYPDNNFDIVFARSGVRAHRGPRMACAGIAAHRQTRGLDCGFHPEQVRLLRRGGQNGAQQTARRRPQQDSAGRKAEVVFPTHYRLNTAALLRKAFGEHALVFVSYVSSEPAYHFGKPLVYRAVKWLNKHLPNSLQPVILVYIRKY